MTTVMTTMIMKVVIFVWIVFILVPLAASVPQRTSQFIVPRVDGVVTAVEAGSGKHLWNFSTGGPLVMSSSSSSSSSPSPSSSTTEDGYVDDALGEGLGSVVLTTAELSLLNAIQRDGLKELYPEANTVLGVTPFMSADGTIFLSHKHSKRFAVDPSSGSLISEQEPQDEVTTWTKDETHECVDKLQIVRTEHTLETHNGTATRTLTVAHIRAFYQPCDPDQTNSVNIESSPLPSLSTSRLGDLQAFDASGSPLWVFHLPVPHSQLVYSLAGNTLRAIRPKQPVEPLRKIPLSLTHYKGTPYEGSYELPEPIKPLSLPAPDANDRKSIWHWITAIIVCVTAAIWGLVLLRHPRRYRTPTHATRSPPVNSTFTVPRSESTLRLREEHKELQKQFQDLLQQQQLQQEQHRKQAQQLQDLQQQQEQQLKSQLQKQQQQLTQHQQLIQTQNSHSTQPSEVPKTMSRYRADFEEKERLGEGGFGTVFLAINKLDGVQYAVKKVCLTSGNGKENARVLREVRYLALLDHPNIIRYFQSWVEEDEWDEWDECRIGSRLEDYEDISDYSDMETDLEQQEQTQKGFNEGITPRELRYEDSSYEGDESERGGTSESSMSLEASSNSFGLEAKFKDSASSGNDDSISITRSKKVVKKVARLKIGVQSGLDGTFERTSGSTSSPISSNSASFNLPVQRKRPILYIQMQYCHQGTLHQWLTRTDRTVCAREALHIFRQAVQGVAHIHTHSVIHRDLKPPNILISADGVVKIGDFGLSTGGTEDPVPLSPRGTLNRSHTTGVGSPLYCSPEQLMGERYDSKVDIFALGVILYEMFHIFTTQMERVSHITQLREGNIGEQTRELFPQLADLTLKLVQRDPSLRPLAKDILYHPLLTSD